MRRALLGAAGGASAFAAPEEPAGEWDNAASIASDLEALYPEVTFTVTVSGEVVASGYKPANGVYDFLYTRDNAYTIWHYPTKFTAAQRRDFASYYLSRRTTGSEADPDGGTLPADFPPDRIGATGTAFYKNSDHPNGDWPLLDGIHFVILALWADWNLTGSTTTFTNNQSAIDDCLAAIPRAVNGCVHFDNPSIDYGFTDRCEKSGDVAYGTALQAWAYKMLDEISDGGSSTAESDTYANLRAAAEAGLATLRQEDGWYAADSEDNADVDDVWATALIVAEGLVSGVDRTASATTLRDAYLAGSITQSGWVRHFNSGQSWNGYTYTAGATFQNGGYWMTPIWDCYRAVNLVDSATATAWVQEVLDTVETQISASGATLAPYEWINGATSGEPKGYTCHAAMVQRFV